MHVQLYTLVTFYEFACICAVYPQFLNASTDTVSLPVCDPNCLMGEGHKPNTYFVKYRYNL